MLNQKYFLLFASVLAIGASARADRMNDEGILLNGNGSVRHMSWFDANGVDPQSKKKTKPDVCRQFEGHIPTINEARLLKTPTHDFRNEYFWTSTLFGDSDPSSTSYYDYDIAFVFGESDNGVGNNDVFRQPRHLTDIGVRCAVGRPSSD